jgi:hypothetical protein
MGTEGVGRRGELTRTPHCERTGWYLCRVLGSLLCYRPGLNHGPKAQFFGVLVPCRWRVLERSEISG